MNKFFHGIGVVLLAMLGSAVLVFILSTITNILTVFDRPPTTFLPADSTLAVLHNPTEDNLTLLAPWFPELSDVKDITDVSTIAVIALPDNKQASVLFTRAQDPLPKKSIGLGSYAVTSPSEKALTLIATSTGKTLSDLSSYKELSDGRDISAPWVFVKKDALTMAPTLPEQVLEALFIRQADAVSLYKEKDTLTITLYGKKNTLNKNVVILPSTQTGDIILLNIMKGREIWHNLSANLEKDTQIILEGILQQLLQNGFGDVVSMEYDILPLLEKNISLHLLHNASGALIVSIRGKVEDDEQLISITEHLHEGARLNLPTTKITNYVFDNRFTTRNIRSDRSTFKEELFVQNDWEIRSTLAVGNEIGLFTAVRDEEFVISNTKETILSNLQEEKVETSNPFPEKGMRVSVRQGNGWIDKNALLSILAKQVPALVGKVDLPLFTDLPSRMLWSMERRGPLTTITLRPS